MQRVLRVVKKTIGKNYKTVIFKAGNIMLQGGTNKTVKSNAVAAMFLSMENNLFLVKI